MLAILALAIRFSSTFVFQAGLIGHLLRRFSAAILVAFLYLALSILLHFLAYRERWPMTEEEELRISKQSDGTSDGQRHAIGFVWSTAVTVLFTMQRTGLWEWTLPIQRSKQHSIRPALLLVQEDCPTVDRPKIPFAVGMDAAENW